MGTKLIGIILSLMKCALIAYVIIVCGMFVFQRHLLYFPDKQAFDVRSFGVKEPFTPMAVQIEDNLVATSWYKPAEDQPKPVIVFMHGNGGHFAYREQRIIPMLSAGYGVALVGYPGYEGNAGSPTEIRLYQAARGVLGALIKQGIAPERLILHGESLGTAVAVQMATEFPVAAVVLESPPTSIIATGTYHYPILPVRYLLWDTFDSLSKIRNVHAPLLIIHGTGDTVVPFAQGKGLFEAANEPKEMLSISGVGHANGLYTEEAKNRLLQFYSHFILE